MTRVPAVLSIAGSDSGGGAGIQADLKAFARCGVHGMTAITAITAQNTVGVEAVEAVSPEMIVAQVRAVAEDIGVDAVKIGMLGQRETVAAVVEALGVRRRGAGGDRPGDGRRERRACCSTTTRGDALVEELLPLATVATPNIPEARVADRARRGRLAGGPGAGGASALGPEAVGRHRRPQRASWSTSSSTARSRSRSRGERHPDGAAHGSGCTHSSALAAFLARGAEPLQAAAAARQITSLAVGAGLDGIGQGPGPVDVFDLAASRPRRVLSADSALSASLRPCVRGGSPVDFVHEHRRRQHRDQPPATPLGDRLRRARPRPRARLHEGDRLRRRRAQPADDRDRQHLDRGDALQLPPARRSPSTSKTASAPPAARRWSSTPSPSPTG